METSKPTAGILALSALFVFAGVQYPEKFRTPAWARLPLLTWAM